MRCLSHKAKLCTVASCILTWGRAMKGLGLGAWKDAMEARRLSRCMRIGASLQLHASLASWLVRARLKGFLAFVMATAAGARERGRGEVTQVLGVKLEEADLTHQR